MGKGFNFVLLAAIVIAATPGLLQQYHKQVDPPPVPPEAFMTVESIEVRDTPEGEDPLVWVDRQVHRTFFAEWDVWVLDAASGELVENCDGHGRNDYHPTNVMPRPLNLFAWWMLRSEPCNLDVGSYFVRTIWHLRAEDGFTRMVRADSNVFRITTAQ